MALSRSLAAALPAIALAVSLGAALGSTPARAQFRNQGVQASLGWLGLGTWDRVIHEGKAARQTPPEEGWNLTDQPTLGAGYFFAVGYDLWVDSQVVLGAWTTVLDNSDTNTPVITLAASTGLRYNFLSERIRPFFSAHIQYLQLIAFPPAGATASIPGNGFLGNTPFFIGVRPGGGVEWVFGDEVSVTAELSMVGFLVPDADRGLGGLFLPASTGRVYFNVYF